MEEKHEPEVGFLAIWKGRMKHSGKQQQEMQRKEKKGGVLVNGEREEHGAAGGGNIDASRSWV